MQQALGHDQFEEATRAGNLAEAARGCRRAGRKLSRRRNGIVRPRLQSDCGSFPAADLCVGKGYGSDSRYAKLGSMDNTIQASSGFISITGFPEHSGETSADVYRHGHRQSTW